MSTDAKVIGWVGVFMLAIIGGIWLLSSKEQEKLGRPLLGEEMQVSAGHVPEGTSIQYNSDPPAGGQHYPVTAHAGFYDKAPADGYLVHSLEHGAVILWYNPKQLSKDQIEQLKTIFNQTSGKGIMAPRESMNVPVALSSWGRVLKLNTIDEAKIKEFIETNNNRAPEKAPI